jgi:hypothetical protein
MPTFAIELESEGLLFDVLLNDVRIAHDLTGVPRIREDRVNHWIVPGDNVLEVWLGLPESEEPLHAFELDLLRWDSGETRKSAERIAHYKYAAELKLPAASTRRVFDATVRVEDHFGNWEWQYAEHGPLEEADRSAIVDIIRDLHGAVVRGDVPHVRKRLYIQNAEMARAYGIDRDARDAKQRKFLESCVSSDRWRELFLYHSQAGGRLVFVTDRNGLPPVRGVARATTFDLPSGFSRVAGEWTIVR